MLELDRELDESEQKELVAQIEADPAVEYAEADRLASTSWVPNDVYTNYQWSLWPHQGGVNFAPGVGHVPRQQPPIAVLDTGITSHGDLNGKVVPGRDFVNDTNLSRDGNYRDSNPRDEGDWSGAGECSQSARNWCLAPAPTWPASLPGSPTTAPASPAPHRCAGVQHQVRVLGKCTNG